MSSVDTAVRFLMNRRFGIAVLMPAIQSFQKIQNVASEKPDLVIQVESYEKLLRSKPENELMQIYKQALIDDENARFYNLKSANADFVHWSKAAHWTIDEAIALSFGKEPEIVNWKTIEKFKDESAFVKSFRKRRDLALRASCWKKYQGVLPPLEFIKWANEIKIDLPPQLIDEVAKIGGSAVDWHKMYLGQKAEYDQLVLKLKQLSDVDQKPESTRKTENVLQAFAAIAIDAYGYDPKAEKSIAPGDIADALNKLGKKVDPRTIRIWLKEGSQFLPAKPHKD